ncbi:MAG: T9SS type A sorting domain-containing protein [Bacteroidetes bacterium]|jgi:hypothetical protein|nr:T9SS type A sorting domain-containing protein [Bacteroidota bacterium]
MGVFRRTDFVQQTNKVKPIKNKKMANKLTLLFLCVLHLNLNAQQWIDKKYDYDSTLNVPYGTAVNFNGSIDTLTMDIYTPICDDINHVSRKPLLLWIHGGAFLAGDKNEMKKLCIQFSKRGYITATINYRLGFIPDDVAWNCNYPNYSCVFATDSAEWYRAYYRAIQDGKGALRYLINRNAALKIDTNNIFVAGESAGGFIALGIGLLDTISEKPIQANAISNAPNPNSNALGCQYCLGELFNGVDVARPDLGDIEGTIEPTNINFTIKGIGNMFGGMLSDLLKSHKANSAKPAIYSFHQPCDLIVPIDSGQVFAGLSWCMTNGYNCYGIHNTAKIYGSRAFSNWNINYGYGYNIHNEFTTTNFPYSFIFGTASCLDQVSNPCHAYDNSTLRENNLASFFAPLITTNPICDTTLFPNGIHSINAESYINIYPNPSSSILNIHCINCLNSSFTIYDMLGQKYIEEAHIAKEETKVNINHLHAGMYLIKIQNKNGLIKIIKFTKE